jgi:hypothetical protein
MRNHYAPACTYTGHARIDIEWTGPVSLRVTMDAPSLEWSVTATQTPMALSDIVTERPLTQAIVCTAELWASCIGGAAQIDDYRSAIESAGLRVETVRDNTAYAFLSGSARGAPETYSIKNISLLAVKPT